jgi:DNA-binding transcriptional LysR family regulator
LPSLPAIELRHLRYFLAVFEELHFGHAAERLHIAQPPLSQAIRKLEQELGVALFVRTSRAVEPTAAGTVLAEEARDVLSRFEFAVTETRRAGAREIPLRIGFSPFLPTSRLQRFLTELKKRDPSLQPEIIHMWTLEQVARLRAGRLDLGVFDQVEEYPELESESLFPGEQISAFVPADHPLAARSALKPEDVASETLITFPRSLNPAFYDRYMIRFEELGFRFRRLHEINSTDPRDALLAVASGLGLVFGPMFLAELGDEGRDFVRRPLDPPLRLPETVVAWRANAPRRVRSLLVAVRDVARALHAEAPAAGLNSPPASRPASSR